MNKGCNWIDELFTAIDRRDHAAFASFLAADARFRFGNQPPVDGREAIARVVAEFFASLKNLQHRIDDRWLLADVGIVSGSVNYTRHDDRILRVPFANILKFRADGIHDYQIFVDNGDLFSA